MNYTVFELLWLFVLYSFCGWLLETVVAAVKHKRLVNRGMVNLPFSIILERIYPNAINVE